MTEQQLMQYRRLQCEINMLEEEICRLRSQATGAGGVLSDMPRSSGVSDKVADLTVEIVALADDLQKAHDRAIEMRKEIEKWLSTIDDSEMRIIVRMRYVDGDSWRKIGDALHLDWSWVYRKTRRFLKSNKSNKEL